jgi:diguanylate cyclase (GGDEF)-like protein/PAS domain S-box-containing protein
MATSSTSRDAHRHRILVVGDQASLHQHVRVMLWATGVDGDAVGEEFLERTAAFFTERGMEIDSARSGEKGVAMVDEARKGGRPYSLAIVGMDMSKALDGVETVERMWAIDPDLQALLCAKEFQRTWSEIASRLERGDQYLLLTTPFEKLELVQAVHALTEKWWLKKAVDRANERRYRALYHSTPAMFFTLAGDGRIVSANRYGAEQLGYTVRELVGQPADKLLPEHHAEAYSMHVQACFSAGEGVHRWQGAKVRKDGSIVWVRETSRVVPDAKGRATVLSVCEDVTHSRRLSQLLTHQASHDSLTGLVNRREFERRLDGLLGNPAGSDAEHALCYLDLDQFKVVNDTCGHGAGDELLRQLTYILVERARRSDTLARLGGDEFGLLLVDCSIVDAKAVAESLREAVNEFRFVWRGRTFRLGASIGLVPFGAQGRDAAEILKAADAACYAAKDGGRNRVRLYRPDSEELADRRGEMQWVTRLRQAIEAHELCLFYQPIVPVHAPDGETTHYELLVRMRNDEGEVIPPGAFMPAAERYHLATMVDAWVIETATSWLAANPKHLERLQTCSINLSGHSLADDDFMTRLKGALGRVPTEKICFEVTETAAIANLATAVEFMKELKDLGCRFALDDFGSGLSSFAYLRNLPVDYLKIDGNFIKNIADDPIDLAMVTAIDQVGKVMGKKTVAEFVEDRRILAKLREIGVDYAQGYCIARPRPIETLAERAAAGTHAA